MRKGAMAFIAGGVLVLAVTAIWVAKGEYDRREEERRVMEFLTTPSTKGFEPVTND